MEKEDVYSVRQLPADQLWQRFCTNDAQALGVLATRFYKPLLNYGLRFLPNRDELKDILQELFVDLWQRRNTLPLPTDVKAYLLGALRNKIYKQRLHTQRLPQLTELPFDGGLDAVAPSVESAWIQAETQLKQQQCLQQLLADLPKRQQEVIYLHYYEGLDADQIAQVMAIGRQSVYNLLSRTLKDLRAAWGAIVALVLILLTGALTR